MATKKAKTKTPIKTKKPAKEAPLVQVRITSDKPIKLGNMQCARGATANISKERADALVADNKAEVIY